MLSQKHMEEFAPITDIPSETTENNPAALHPLAKAGIEIAMNVGRAFVDEVAPEFNQTPQQERARLRSDYSQQALLEALLIQSQIDILDAQNPSYVFSRLFGNDTTTQQDAAHITTLRQELQQITNKQPVSMEPMAFVQQQAMHVASASGMSG